MSECACVYVARELLCTLSRPHKHPHTHRNTHQPWQASRHGLFLSEEECEGAKPTMHSVTESVRQKIGGKPLLFSHEIEKSCSHSHAHTYIHIHTHTHTHTHARAHRRLNQFGCKHSIRYQTVATHTCQCSSIAQERSARIAWCRDGHDRCG